MIDCGLQTSGGAFVPLYVPNGDVRDIARAVGYPEEDLFRIEVPAGASRVGKSVGMVAQSALSSLYGSDVLGFGTASATLKWRENNLSGYTEMPVFLMPPRPLFMVPDSTGVALVDLYDVRYAWSQYPLEAADIAQVSGITLSNDGRFVISNATNTSLTGLVNAITTKLATLYGTFNTASYAPNAILVSRLSDMVFTPNTSLALALDMILALTGYQLQYDFSTNEWRVIAVGNDRSVLGAWMTSNKIACGGGGQATSTTGSPVEPLMSLWDGNSAYQDNAMPATVEVTYPYRNVEGLTRHNFTTNSANQATAQALLFSSQSQSYYLANVVTGRSRIDGIVRTLHETRPVVSGTAPNTDFLAANSTQTASPGWDYVALSNEIASLLAQRTTVMFGRIMWGGWATPPNGTYRTNIRYALVHRNGDLVPVTMTWCDTDDWLVGPDGLLPTDPRDIISGKGLTSARRLALGQLHIDSAAPQTRVFAAKITGNEQWAANKWTYSFEEVDPNFQITTAAWILPVSYPRKRTDFVAKNLCEYGNNLVTGVIAPGVDPANYPNATVAALPISNDTVVTMVEYFSTQNPNTVDTTNPPQYWFSMPNAVDVDCIIP